MIKTVGNVLKLTTNQLILAALSLTTDVKVVTDGDSDLKVAKVDDVFQEIRLKPVFKGLKTCSKSKVLAIF